MQADEGPREHWRFCVRETALRADEPRGSPRAALMLYLASCFVAVGVWMGVLATGCGQPYGPARPRHVPTMVLECAAMSVPTLKLYDFPANTGEARWSSLSPYVMEVDRALRLAKLPYDRVDANMWTLKKLNPLGQLPVLAVGSENVPDSTRILRRIEQLAPGALLRGLQPAQVAEAWLWEEFSDTALYPFVLATRWADDRGWPVPRDAFFAPIPFPLRGLIANSARKAVFKRLVERDFLRAGLSECYERLGQVLDALDTRAPEDGFWLGAHPSVADLGLFAHLHSLRFPRTPWQAEEVARRGRLSRYLDRVEAATA